MSLTWSQQLSSLMLPPVHPPAVTKMALNFIPSDLIPSMASLLFVSTCWPCFKRMFWWAEGCSRKSTLTTLCLLKMEITLEPSWPAPPMQRIFFMILQLMLLQNQFISPQELITIHFRQLFSRPKSHTQTALLAQSSILTKVISQVEEGFCPISQKTQDAAQLLQQLAQSESQKRLEANRRKKQERSNLNQLLYGNNRNKTNQKQGSLGQRLLSLAEHHQFIKSMREDNLKRQTNRIQKEHRESSLKEAKQQAEKKMTEDERMASIQRKKQAIKENLLKMRENHDKMMATEQESRKLYSTIRKKKRLYQEMKELQDQKIFQHNQEIQKKMKKRLEQSKLDLNEIHLHEKEYIEMKKQNKSQQKSRINESATTQSHHNYHPPPHSKKLSKFLEEQYLTRNQFEIEKKKLEDKLQKIAQYSSVLRERYKHKSPPVSKTVATDRENRLNSESSNLKEHINRIHLGNEYMKQAKLKIRKRAKTEEKYFNPEVSETIEVRRKGMREKNKTITLEYIPENKRQEHIQKMKREEIQKIINQSELSDGDRLNRLKIVDERLSKELKMHEGKMKGRYSTQSSQNTLNLLLGAIKAKINLMNAISK